MDLQLELKFARNLIFDREAETPGEVGVIFVAHARARHYIIRVLDLKTVRVTIPRRGTRREAMAFLESRRGWLESQLDAIERRQSTQSTWRFGAKIWFRGQKEVLVPVTLDAEVGVSVGDLVVPLTSRDAPLQAPIEAALRDLAAAELPDIVGEFSQTMAVAPTRITIRNQRTRWGSCSAKGAISLNWRLVQIPLEVRDYIVIHELSHLRHLNHSPAFWACVQQYCPRYRTHERWLKAHPDIISATVD